MEVVISASLTTLILLGMAYVVTFAGRVETTVGLQSDTNQAASKALAHMTEDVREAVRVTINSSTDFTIYYPTVDASTGHYNLTEPNYNYWIEYYVGGSDGSKNPTGTYLWRTSSSGGNPLKITNNLTDFSAGYFPVGATTSIRLTLQVTETSRGFSGKKLTGNTLMSQRVLYLRNYFASF